MLSSRPVWYLDGLPLYALGIIRVVAFGTQLPIHRVPYPADKLLPSLPSDDVTAIGRREKVLVSTAGWLRPAE